MAQKAAEAAKQRMDSETERVLAELIMRRADLLHDRAGAEGVLAFLRRPVVRGQLNERFLQNTLRGVFSANRRAQEAEAWETRELQLQREARGRGASSHERPHDQRGRSRSRERQLDRSRDRSRDRSMREDRRGDRSREADRSRDRSRERSRDRDTSRSTDQVIVDDQQHQQSRSRSESRQPAQARLRSQSRSRSTSRSRSRSRPRPLSRSRSRSKSQSTSGSTGDGSEVSSDSADSKDGDVDGEEGWIMTDEELNAMLRCLLLRVW